MAWLVPDDNLLLPNLWKNKKCILKQSKGWMEHLWFHLGGKNSLCILILSKWGSGAGRGKGEVNCRCSHSVPIAIKRLGCGLYCNSFWLHGKKMHKWINIIWKGWMAQWIFQWGKKEVEKVFKNTWISYLIISQEAAKRTQKRKKKKDW